MADLYRKSSIERLSNPEQLDRAIVISKPMSWLALLGALLIIIVTLVWSFVGKLPTTVSIEGLITGPANIGAVYSHSAGVVYSISKKAGDSINTGDEIAKIKMADGKIESLKANCKGTLSQLLVAADDAVFAGSEIARYTPVIDASQVVVAYVPAEYSQKLEKGMSAQVYLSSIDSQKYGHLEATVESVGEYPANTGNLSFVLGANNMMAERFTANGPVVSVILKLKTDSASKSGLYWSNKNGNNLTVQNGAFVNSKIVIEESAPINKLFKANN